MNWKNKRVLVTGGSGFLGKVVVERLERAGANVFNASLCHHDLRRQEDAYAAIYWVCPDIVVHLAGTVGGLRANASKPATFFYDNLMMGVNLMEAARVYHVKKFVQMGSACEYPKNTSYPTKESEVWNGYPEETNAPYGIAKRALLAMGQAYREQYGMNVIHLLSTGLYGPGDNFDLGTCHVVPALIRKMIEAKPGTTVDVMGSGLATRDFLYVEDAAKAIILAAEKYDDSKPVNIGTGREVSIEELATTIKYLTKFSGALRFTGDNIGQERRVLDAARAHVAFGWRAETFLIDGLRDTINWYRRQNA